jgi:hypothetical protein
MGANNVALGEYLVYIRWCIMGSEVVLEKKSPKDKHFLCMGIFCCKFLILKNSLSINRHKLVV